MKTTINALPFAIAAAFALTAVSAQAASPWVTTRTEAFMPRLSSTPTADGYAAEAKLAQHAAKAVAMHAGQAVHVTVSLNLRNEAALNDYLNQLHTPGSFNYQRYMSPEEFTASFAPTDSDVRAVVDHLRQAGFVQIEVSPNRQLITANGTAGTVKSAFNTTLKTFSHEGRQVFANDAAAQVPSHLGHIVGAVLGLQNVSLAKTHHTPVQRHANESQVHAKAAIVAASSGSATGHYPTEFPGIYNASTVPTASQTVVGIISEGDLSPTITDLNTFLSNQGLGAVSTSVVKTGPSGSTYTDTDGQDEWNLDSQSIVGAAGGQVKKLVFYAAPSMQLSDITAAFNRAVTDNVAKVINVSLGSCEADSHSDGSQAADDNIFKQAVAQGQVFSVSTGDAGTYNCSVSRVSGAPGVPAKSSYDVSEPASSPYVIAVGGTEVYTNGDGSYAREVVWNEGLSPVGQYDASGDVDNTKRLWATGGGFSKYEAAPSWQSGITGNTKRGLPDIAFDAAQASGAIIIVNGQEGTIGGTSLAAPIFTGFWARLQSANGNTLKFPATAFYKYFPTNTTLIHDVTSGINGSGGYGYKAKAGWDAATGFGSLNVANLNTFIRSHGSDFAVKK